MKTAMKALATLAISLGSVEASAIVVDKLDCSLLITDNATGESARSDQQINLIRESSLDSGGKTAIKLATNSKGSMATKFVGQGYYMYAEVSFNFNHAFRIDEHGQRDGRQYSCVPVNAGWCAPTNGPCAAMSVTCRMPGDPFDDVNGWKKTGVIVGTDIPQFDIESAASFSGDVKDQHGVVRGSSKLQCKYLGTKYDVPADETGGN